ncbi:hypothetical protein BDZ89DRAFT_1010178 [Hymenopellis radicata]|nr:hypothetical protein BDZ89DRAFT_1010178 [Hymenopellis radicata]
MGSKSPTDVNSDVDASPDNSGNDNNNNKNNEKRVPLACHRCRTKRARCSGEKPICKTCAKVGEECTWPTGRKRKRTRREMEEEERKERNRRETQESFSGHGNDNGDGGLWGHMDPLNAANMWDFPMHATSSSYIWPEPVVPQLSLPTPEAVPGLPLPARPPEKHSASLVRALESPVAYIDNDPSQPDGLELYYYRFSGSTAIHPGINRISLKLQPRTTGGASAPVPTIHSKPGSPEPPEAMFDDAGLPLPHVHLPLLDTFFSTMSPYFPSISRRRMEERLETGTMSAFMLNCICALSARFHSSGSASPAKACAPFITKAQELIIPLLHLPTSDVVTGLLLLSWANYGQSSESGLWQFYSMAIRMALDLGMHEISEIYESAAHVVRSRLLFWSLFVTDRILAFSTGRPPSISEDMIEIPLPTDDDFFPDPAGRAEMPGAVPFQYWVRLMVLCGRIAGVLNGRRGRVRTLVATAADGGGGLGGLQSQLVAFYADLPPGMKWGVENFRVQEGRGHGGTYLTLHLWANAVMALIYHPELLTSPSGIETPLSQNMEVSIKLSLSSSRTISECLVYADLFSSQSYLTSPFVVQPIYVACLAFLHDMKMSALGIEPLERTRTADQLLTSIAKQSLSALIKAMHRMEHYWSGISYVSSVLDDKAAALGYARESGSKSNLKTFISLPDKGLLRRFTNPDLKTGPPTETSLRASMAKEAAESNTCSLDELLSSYSVEGFYVQPVDSFDLQSLLSGGVGDGSEASMNGSQGGPPSS